MNTFEMLLLGDILKLTYHVFSSNDHGVQPGSRNPKAQYWAQRFNIEFSSQQPSGLFR